MNKTYHLDTSILLEGENTIQTLRNGEENQIRIPITVINELDKLSKDNTKRAKVVAAIQDIVENKEIVTFTGNVNELTSNDDRILRSVIDSDDKDPILVTNDVILQLKSYIHDVKSEEYKSSIPFQSESQKYTGIVDYYEGDKYINNCFYFKDGKLFHYTDGREIFVNNNRTVWNVEPKNIYQSAAMELMLNSNIKLVTIQGIAGSGKTFLSLASALHTVLQLKKHKKIIAVKYPVEIGEKMGFLPGSISEKMEPYWKSMYSLLLKLHDIRKANKVFINPEKVIPEINPKFFEFMPVNYLRGDNVDDAFVVISEAQNIPRHDMRTILTRMGENVKCVVEGDITQIDNCQCNINNNGLNWLVKKLKGNKEYGHISINGKTTRGPICDLIVNSGF